MASALRTTPLTHWHEVHGGRMVDFAGFRMPVLYEETLTVEEVRCVRQRSGLFDLCHMGRLVLRGADRVAAADRVLSQNVAKIPEGAIRYALICEPGGGVIDDVLVYRGAEEVHVVINASNRETDDAWFRTQIRGMAVTLENPSDQQAMIALQGPASAAVLAGLCDPDPSGLGYYRFAKGRLLGGIETLVSRTGYTGEDGFELFFPKTEAVRVWEALLEAGRPHGLKPIGLAARDVCRTEAGMPLYGHEMNRTITPLEACLEFGVDLDKPFVGRDALVAQRRAGVPRRLVGLAIEGKRILRDGCPLLRGGSPAGHVTSGTFSPTLDRPIAMALVPAALAVQGTSLQGDLRGKMVEAKVDGLPFYSRKRKKTAPRA
ncbi:MAG: glycine cleavage system aminomethyltransferase GcvT [Planctomycetaceae bacterium]